LQDLHFVDHLCSVVVERASIGDLCVQVGAQVLFPELMGAFTCLSESLLLILEELELKLAKSAMGIEAKAVGPL